MTRPEHRLWTVTEQKKLDDLLGERKSAREIATVLQRTSQAICSRPQRLDVKRNRSTRQLTMIGLKATK
jgi:hypothetical protein